MKLEDVIITKDQVYEAGFTVVDSFIANVDVDIVGYFNNCTCLRITGQDRSILSLHQNTGNLGYLIRSFVELLDLTREDGIKLSKIKNIRCRLVLQNGCYDSCCVGFGHPTKDEFVLSEVFTHINEI